MHLKSKKTPKPVGGSKEYKSSWQDLTSDFENGHVKFSSDDMEAEPFAGIRAAQAGTLDREASARSKVSPSQISALTHLEHTGHGEVNELEMNPAVAQTLRMMMRGDLMNGIQDMEKNLTSTLGP